MYTIEEQYSPIRVITRPIGLVYDRRRFSKTFIYGFVDRYGSKIDEQNGASERRRSGETTHRSCIMIMVSVPIKTKHSL